MKALLTTDDVCHNLGISRGLLWGLIRTGMLPVIRISGSRHLRIDEDDVLALIERMKQTREAPDGYQIAIDATAAAKREGK